MCFYCAEIVLHSHLNGKKHQSLIKFRELQQSQAERSAFVRGFMFGTTEAQLKNVFAVFGNVLKVVISKEQVCSANLSCLWFYLLFCYFFQYT